MRSGCAAASRRPKIPPEESPTQCTRGNDKASSTARIPQPTARDDGEGGAVYPPNMDSNTMIVQLVKALLFFALLVLARSMHG
jgi:hypothetical protein